MKNILLISIIILLTGCATKTQIKEVYIPVSQKCYDESIKKPQKPSLLTDNLNGDEKIDLALNNALRDVNVLKNYSERLETMICN